MTEAMAHPRPELAVAHELGLPSTRPLGVRLAEWYAGRSFDPTEPEGFGLEQATDQAPTPAPSRANVIDLDVARRRRRRHQRTEAQVYRKDPWSEPWS